MSEMVERVQRAIGKALGPGMAKREVAIAAIEAMREPTEAMIQAGRREIPAEIDQWIEGGRVHARMKPMHECVSPAGPWQAMIDAALSDTEEGVKGCYGRRWR